VSCGGYWILVPTDRYLDMRHRNWALAEHRGDVVFASERGVVLVHRERAEHIARTLIGGREVLVLEDALALPVRASVGLVRLPPAQPQRLVIPASNIHLRDIVGWLGILAGAAVFIAALAVPLDDTALLLTVAIVLRSGQELLITSSFAGQHKISYRPR
jgi:hypothetical protein